MFTHNSNWFLFFITFFFNHILNIPHQYASKTHPSLHPPLSSASYIVCIFFYFSRFLPFLSLFHSRVSFSRVRTIAQSAPQLHARNTYVATVASSPENKFTKDDITLAGAGQGREQLSCCDPATCPGGPTTSYGSCGSSIK